MPSGTRATGYRLHPDVVWISRPDGSSRLMHMSANVCAMDDASTELLRALIAVGPAQAASDLAERHGLNRAQIAADVDAFVADLRKQKLVQPSGAGRSPVDGARALAAETLIPAALRVVRARGRGLGRQAWGLLWTSKWALAQFGWARSVRAWERVYPRPTTDPPGTAETLAAIDRAVREAAARSWGRVECKERAFACWGLARERGIPAVLVVGVTHHPLNGHVWVESATGIISDDPEHCRPFEPVARYG